MKNRSSSNSINQSEATAGMGTATRKTRTRAAAKNAFTEPPSTAPPSQLAVPPTPPPQPPPLFTQTKFEEIGRKQRPQTKMSLSSRRRGHRRSPWKIFFKNHPAKFFLTTKTLKSEITLVQQVGKLVAVSVYMSFCWTIKNPNRIPCAH